ncbi:hypothetical protein CYMTET_26960 [Cymbomonas tetramitiformis]|uniref:Nephrocystin 3-like N-terminal domain-containing protein n=1 Tax=Cymbomonas tetramitiformis TaxID=36881 RepID=A0AAE0FS79_9CHLO|nr:hypothetical protein CYMTET_26960 [Cymbomonas tetramitiformis]
MKRLKSKSFRMDQPMKKLKSRAASPGRPQVLPVYMGGHGTVRAREILQESVEDVLREVLPAHDALSVCKMHRHVAAATVDSYVQPKSVIREVRSYLNTSKLDGKPLVVTGAQGCGKTALLAHIIAREVETSDFKVVAPFFLRGTPGGTDLGHLVDSLSQEICSGLPTPTERSLKLLRKFPIFDRLLQAFILCATFPDVNVLVVVDGLEDISIDMAMLAPEEQAEQRQMEETGNAVVLPLMQLAWLPMQLPPNVKMVVSMVDASASQLTLEWIEALEEFECKLVTISHLNKSLYKDVVDSMLRRNDTLDLQERQQYMVVFEDLWEHKHLRSPFALNLFILEIVGPGEEDDYIAELVLAAGNRSLLRRVLQRLLYVFDWLPASMPANTLQLLWAAGPQGIAPDELLDVARQLCEAPQLHQLHWQTLYHAMNRLGLVRRAGGMVWLSSRMMQDAVASEFFTGKPPAQRQAHRALFRTLEMFYIEKVTARTKIDMVDASKRIRNTVADHEFLRHKRLMKYYRAKGKS